jgi:signal recognition particle subunit SRP54
VNIKLVASLRQKVKAKVKASLDAIAADKTKENNRKNLVQKVCQPGMLPAVKPMFFTGSLR